MLAAVHVWWIRLRHTTEEPEDVSYSLLEGQPRSSGSVQCFPPAQYAARQ